MRFLLRFVFVSALVVSSIIVHAEDAEASEDGVSGLIPSFFIGLDAVSTYYFRGDVVNGDTQADGLPNILGPAIQPYIEAEFDNGLSVGLWTSFLLTQRFDPVSGNPGAFDNTQLDEFDVYFSYGQTWEILSLSVGFTHYALPSDGSGFNGRGNVSFQLNAADPTDVTGTISVAAQEEAGEIFVALGSGDALPFSIEFRNFFGLYGLFGAVGGWNTELEVSGDFDMGDAGALSLFALLGTQGYSEQPGNWFRFKHVLAGVSYELGLGNFTLGAFMNLGLIFGMPESAAGANDGLAPRLVPFGGLSFGFGL